MVLIAVEMLQLMQSNKSRIGQKSDMTCTRSVTGLMGLEGGKSKFEDFKTFLMVRWNQVGFTLKKFIMARCTSIIPKIPIELRR